MLYPVVVVALGGALGSVARYLVSLLAVRLFGPAFPWGTVFVNLFGSFLMGLFVEMIARRFGGSPELRLFIATGILGGFTTFSSFALDASVLYERGDVGQAALYVGGSVLLGIAALFLGLALGRHLG